jgi:hypothetical protein
MRRFVRLFERLRGVVFPLGSLLALILGSCDLGRSQTPPALISVTPSSVPVGWNGTLVVRGSGFLSGDWLNLNSGDMPTTYVDSTTLTATIPCCETLRPSIGRLTARHIRESTVSSNALSFKIGEPPIISSLSPNSVTLGGPDVNVVINGSGFVPGVIAYITNPNGGPLVAMKTTYNSSLLSG